MSNVFVIQCPQCKHALEISMRSVRKPAVQASVLDKTEESKMPKQEKAQADPEDMERIEEYLDLINDELLNDKTKEFISKTRQNYLKWGKTMFFSENQMEWLKDIAGVTF